MAEEKKWAARAGGLEKRKERVKRRGTGAEQRSSGENIHTAEDEGGTKNCFFLCFPSKTPTAASACDVTQHLHQFDFFHLFFCSKSFNRPLDVEHYHVFSPHSSSSLSADRSSEQQGV